MNFVRLRRTPKLAVPKHETDTFFVDAAGVFKKMAPDGTVSEVGGGGGSLPDPIIEPVVIQPTDDSVTLLSVKDAVGDGLLSVKKGRLEFDAKAVDGSNNLFILRAPNGTAIQVEVNNDGTPGDIEITNGSNLIEIDTGRFTVFATPGIQLNADAWIEFKAPAVLIEATSAPSNDVLDNGEFGLWLDATNGATKLMVKAKSANGTVVTGELPLA